MRDIDRDFHEFVLLRFMQDYGPYLYDAFAVVIIILIFGLGFLAGHYFH